MTNAEARCNKSLRPRKPEGSLGRTAQDVHLDSHTAPELWLPFDHDLLFYDSPTPSPLHLIRHCVVVGGGGGGGISLGMFAHMQLLCRIYRTQMHFISVSTVVIVCWLWLSCHCEALSRGSCWDGALDKRSLPLTFWYRLWRRLYWTVDVLL